MSSNDDDFEVPSYMYTHAYLWIERSIAMLSLFILTVLLPYHTYTIYNYFHKKEAEISKSAAASSAESDSSRRNRILSHIVTIITLFSYLLWSLQHFLS